MTVMSPLYQLGFFLLFFMEDNIEKNKKVEIHILENLVQDHIFFFHIFLTKLDYTLITHSSHTSNTHLILIAICFRSTLSIADFDSPANSVSSTCFILQQYLTPVTVFVCFGFLRLRRNI